jgi:ketosteroid isomerase-like protein
MTRAYGVVVFVSMATLGMMAQSSAEEEVRKANDGILAAAAAGDKAAYTKLLADDLRWIDGNGRFSSKAERIRDLTPPADRLTTPFDRIFRDVDVKVYGITAVLICRSDWTDAAGLKKSQLVHRVFVNRGGQWQMVSHSPTPLPDRR